MLRTFSSDWLKTKRTAYRTIVFLLPPLFVFVTLWYLAVHSRTPNVQENAYALFFDLWTMLVPMLIGLLAGMLGSQEEQAGSFNSLLGTPVSRIALFSSKILLLILTTVLDLLVSVLLFLAGLITFLHTPNLQIAVFLEGTLFTILGSLALSVLHLWLSFASGPGASISLGGAGALIAAICGITSAGDRIWRLLPWAWPARLSQIPEELLITHGRTLELWTEIWQGTLPALLLFLLATACAMLWFDRWEGRKSYE